MVCDDVWLGYFHMHQYLLNPNCQKVNVYYYVFLKAMEERHLTSLDSSVEVESTLPKATSGLPLQSPVGAQSQATPTAVTPTVPTPTSSTPTTAPQHSTALQRVVSLVNHKIFGY